MVFGRFENNQHNLGLWSRKHHRIFTTKTEQNWAFLAQVEALAECSALAQKDQKEVNNRIKNRTK